MSFLLSESGARPLSPPGQDGHGGSEVKSGARVASRYVQKPLMCDCCSFQTLPSKTCDQSIKHGHRRRAMQACTLLHQKMQDSGTADNVGRPVHASVLHLPFRPSFLRSPDLAPPTCSPSFQVDSVKSSLAEERWRQGVWRKKARGWGDRVIEM